MVPLHTDSRWRVHLSPSQSETSNSDTLSCHNCTVTTVRAYITIHYGYWSHPQKQSGFSSPDWTTRKPCSATCILVQQHPQPWCECQWLYMVILNHYMHAYVHSQMVTMLPKWQCPRTDGEPSSYRYWMSVLSQSQLMVLNFSYRLPFLDLVVLFLNLQLKWTSYQTHFHILTVKELGVWGLLFSCNTINVHMYRVL